VLGGAVVVASATWAGRAWQLRWIGHGEVLYGRDGGGGTMAWAEASAGSTSAARAYGGLGLERLGDVGS